MTTAHEPAGIEWVRRSPLAPLTLDQFDRMIAGGVFDVRQPQRRELIRGEIRQMTPIGYVHVETVRRLMYWSIRNTDENEIHVIVQSPIGLAELQSAPEPDIAWVRASAAMPKGRPAPSEIMLVIEVAESSLAYDTTEKAQLYAAVEIPEYWVVNLVERSIEVRRDPAAGRYRSLQTYAGDQEIRPAAAPDAVLRPAMLWL